MYKKIIIMLLGCLFLTQFSYAQEKSKNEYATVNTVEIGGMIWNSIKAYRGGADEQFFWVNFFTNFLEYVILLISLTSVIQCM